MAPRMRRRITSARRQEIEKEQEAMSRSIVRPFDVVSGLPVSYSKPPYGHYEEVLKNPLTVKDSGVLYRSLMKSRNNYINGGAMFQLFWSKAAARPPKAGKEVVDRPPVLGPDVNARDVMVKLSDAFMTLGPHNFEIRLFIAKDQRSEKKKLEEQKELQKQAQIKLEAEKSLAPTVAKPAPKPDVKTVPKPAKPAPKPLPPTPRVVPPAPRPAVPRPAGAGTITSKPMLGKPAPPPLTASQANKSAAADKNDPSSMSSPQNVLMISNLNSIARIDPSLNLLMKIVASGNASQNQIMTFQGYIARAREMGPPPHPWLHPDTRIDPHQPLRIRKVLKETKRPKLGKDQKLTAFQEKYISNATLVFEFAENPNVRYVLPKNAICEVLPSKNSSDERDILMSFLWIHNQKELDKYNKDLEEYEDEIKERERQKNEEEAQAKEEQERLEKEQKEAQEPVQEEAEEAPDSESAAPEETDATDGATDTATDAANDTPADAPADAADAADAPAEVAAPKRRPPPPKKKKPVKPPKKLVRPIEPDYRFTACSFVLHDIPAKFVPILTNSVNHEDKVRQYMKNIIDKGTRSSSFYLWYQVDGKVDDALAESIRVEINQEEKRVIGVPHNASLMAAAAAAATKKRKIM